MRDIIGQRFKLILGQTKGMTRESHEIGEV